MIAYFMHSSVYNLISHFVTTWPLERSSFTNCLLGPSLSGAEVQQQPDVAHTNILSQHYVNQPVVLFPLSTCHRKHPLGPYIQVQESSV
jgi:hypothetical protein